MKPKKLIRNGTISHLKKGEWEEIESINDLNNLYALKIKEELAEIQKSEHKDINEFADLVAVALSFAEANGFNLEQLEMARIRKVLNKGVYGKWALNNLNPNNPSNKLYFENI